MPKLNQPLSIGLIALGIVAFTAVTIAGAIYVTNTQSAKLANERRKCDVASYDSYKAVIEGGKVKPAHIAAKLCDRLTITNLDDKSRNMAFGRHEKHVSYDGVTEKLLRRGESLSVMLVKPGDYIFHDHYDDGVRATFTVTDPNSKN